MFSVSGRTVVITGGAQGLGRAIADGLLANGANVAILDIDGDKAAEVAASAPSGRALGFGVDASDFAQVKNAIERTGEHFGSIEGIVNNAAVSIYEPIEQMDERTLSLHLDVGVKSVFWTIKAALPFILKNGACVLNVCSGAAVFGQRNAGAYTAMKGALVALSRELAVELGDRNIRVNAISPGPTPTRMTAWLDDDAWALRRNKTPLKRIGSPDDFRNLALFLLSDGGTFITGQHILADGGMSIAMA